jgi:hypothetical protein
MVVYQNKIGIGQRKCLDIIIVSQNMNTTGDKALIIIVIKETKFWPMFSQQMRGKK